MSVATCISCQLPKASLSCGLCAKPVCKKCAEVLPKDAFHYSGKNPFPEKHYCPFCFDAQIAGKLQEYEATLQRAKQVLVFDKAKSEETRLCSRTEKPVRVENCADEADVLLKLAFLAAEKGLNALLDVVVKSEKVRNAGYQTMRWSGTGIPSTF